MDAWGHATLVYEGGVDASTAAVILARGYDQATGRALSTEAGLATAAPIVHLVTAWDGFDNLTQRTDQVNGSTETASYDTLNRLTGSTTTLTGGTSLTRSYRYDAGGNRTAACSGSTCTVYTYGTNGAGPHAVSAVNGNASAYAYNASGEMIRDNGRSLTWSAFGKALSITRGGTTLTLSYGPGNRRIRKTLTGPESETVTYLGGAERLDINGSLSIRRTLSLADITIIDTGGAQSRRLYPITDHLGSTIAIADSSGSLIQGLAYADFGRRYSAGWGAALTTAQALAVNTTLSDRGYTGQESLDAIGLDDYNARLYDPGLGRFLSVDPLIGHPGSTQGINPYSYVANNPLNKTDPTGEVIDNCYTTYCEQHHLGSFGPLIFYGTTGNMDVATHITSSAGPNAPSVQVTPNSPVAQQGTTNPNATGDTNVSKHQVSNKLGNGGEPDSNTVRNTVNRNSDIAPYVHVTKTKDSTTVAIAGLPVSYNGDVTPEQAKVEISQAEKDWTTTITTKNGYTYRSVLTIRNMGKDIWGRSQKGIVQLQACGWDGCKGNDTEGERYGNWIRFHYSYVKHDPVLVGHEFGHLFGFGHQWNSTGDIMSYAYGAHVTAWDIQKLANAYGGG